MAHDRGVKVLVDAVAYAPHRKVDVADLGCDALITSPYKWFAPHSGVLWLSPEVQSDLPRYQIRASHHSGPSVMEFGSTAFEIVAAIGAAADFMVEAGMGTIRAHEESLLAILLPGLLGIPGIHVYGEPEVGPGRVPTVGFTVDGWSPDQVCAALADDEIAGWSGDFYAIDLAQALNLTNTGGWVRLGINLYNSEDDVQRVLSSLTRIAVSRPQGSTR
jgi:selenocysteine lyase/cysteine desulfurase